LSRGNKRKNTKVLSRKNKEKEKKFCQERTKKKNKSFVKKKQRKKVLSKKDKGESLFKREKQKETQKTSPSTSALRLLNFYFVSTPHFRESYIVFQYVFISIFINKPLSTNQQINK
jgi:hypothetical protein